MGDKMNTIILAISGILLTNTLLLSWIKSWEKQRIEYLHTILWILTIVFCSMELFSYILKDF